MASVKAQILVLIVELWIVAGGIEEITLADGASRFVEGLDTIRHHNLE
jgi:hypothetical protein